SSMSRTCVVRIACILACTSVACSSTTTANPSSGGSSSDSGGASTSSHGGSSAIGSNGSSSGSSNVSGSDSSSSGSGGASSNAPGGASTSGSGGANSNGSGGSAPSGVAFKLDATRQTIQGFGINSAWTPSNKILPIDKLFGTTGADAIGLSILRVGMSPTGTLVGPFIPEAKAKGAKIIGSVFSAPASCKSNGNTQHGGFLLEQCFDSFSQDIAKFAQVQGLYAMSIG